MDDQQQHQGALQAAEITCLYDSPAMFGPRARLEIAIELSNAAAGQDGMNLVATSAGATPQQLSAHDVLLGGAAQRGEGVLSTPPPEGNPHRSAFLAFQASSVMRSPEAIIGAMTSQLHAGVYLGTAASPSHTLFGSTPPTYSTTHATDSPQFGVSASENQQHDWHSVLGGAGGGSGSGAAGLGLTVPPTSSSHSGNMPTFNAATVESPNYHNAGFLGASTNSSAALLRASMTAMRSGASGGVGSGGGGGGNDGGENDGDRKTATTATSHSGTDTDSDDDGSTSTSDDSDEEVAAYLRGRFYHTERVPATQPAAGGAGAGPPSSGAATSGVGGGASTSGTSPLGGGASSGGGGVSVRALFQHYAVTVVLDFARSTFDVARNGDVLADRFPLVVETLVEQLSQAIEVRRAKRADVTKNFIRHRNRLLKQVRRKIPKEEIRLLETRAAEALVLLQSRVWNPSITFSIIVANAPRVDIDSSDDESDSDDDTAGEAKQQQQQQQAATAASKPSASSSLVQGANSTGAAPATSVKSALRNPTAERKSSLQSITVAAAAVEASTKSAAATAGLVGPAATKGVASLNAAAVAAEAHCTDPAAPTAPTPSYQQQQTEPCTDCGTETGDSTSVPIVPLLPISATYDADNLIPLVLEADIDAIARDKTFLQRVRAALASFERAFRSAARRHERRYGLGATGGGAAGGVRNDETTTIMVEAFAMHRADSAPTRGIGSRLRSAGAAGSAASSPNRNISGMVAANSFAGGSATAEGRRSPGAGRSSGSSGRFPLWESLSVAQIMERVLGLLRTSSGGVADDPTPCAGSSSMAPLAVTARQNVVVISSHLAPVGTSDSVTMLGSATNAKDIIWGFMTLGPSIDWDLPHLSPLLFFLSNCAGGFVMSYLQWSRGALVNPIVNADWLQRLPSDDNCLAAFLFAKSFPTFPNLIEKDMKAKLFRGIFDAPLQHDSPMVTEAIARSVAAAAATAGVSGSSSAAASSMLTSLTAGVDAESATMTVQAIVCEPIYVRCSPTEPVLAVAAARVSEGWSVTLLQSTETDEDAACGADAPSQQQQQSNNSERSASTSTTGGAAGQGYGASAKRREICGCVATMRTFLHHGHMTLFFECSTVPTSDGVVVYRWVVAHGSQSVVARFVAAVGRAGIGAGVAGASGSSNGSASSPLTPQQQQQQSSSSGAGVGGGGSRAMPPKAAESTLSCDSLDEFEATLAHLVASSESLNALCHMLGRWLGADTAVLALADLPQLTAQLRIPAADQTHIQRRSCAMAQRDLQNALREHSAAAGCSIEWLVHTRVRSMYFVLASAACSCALAVTAQPQQHFASQQVHQHGTGKCRTATHSANHPIDFAAAVSYLNWALTQHDEQRRHGDEEDDETQEHCETDTLAARRVAAAQKLARSLRFFHLSSASHSGVPQQQQQQSGGNQHASDMAAVCFIADLECVGLQSSTVVVQVFPLLATPTHCCAAPFEVRVTMIGSNTTRLDRMHTVIIAEVARRLGFRVSHNGDMIATKMDLRGATLSPASANPPLLDAESGDTQQCPAAAAPPPTERVLSVDLLPETSTLVRLGFDAAAMQAPLLMPESHSNDSSSATTPGALAPTYPAAAGSVESRAAQAQRLAQRKRAALERWRRNRFFSPSADLLRCKRYASITWTYSMPMTWSWALKMRMLAQLRLRNRDGHGRFTVCFVSTHPQLRIVLRKHEDPATASSSGSGASASATASGLAGAAGVPTFTYDVITGTPRQITVHRLYDRVSVSPKDVASSLEASTQEDFDALTALHTSTTIVATMEDFFNRSGTKHRLTRWYEDYQYDIFAPPRQRRQKHEQQQQQQQTARAPAAPAPSKPIAAAPQQPQPVLPPELRQEEQLACFARCGGELSLAAQCKSILHGVSLDPATSVAPVEIFRFPSMAATGGGASSAAPRVNDVLAHFVPMLSNVSTTIKLRDAPRSLQRALLDARGRIASETLSATADREVLVGIVPCSEWGSSSEPLNRESIVMMMLKPQPQIAVQSAPTPSQSQQNLQQPQRSTSNTRSILAAGTLGVGRPNVPPELGDALPIPCENDDGGDGDGGATQAGRGSAAVLPGRSVRSPDDEVDDSAGDVIVLMFPTSTSIVASGIARVFDVDICAMFAPTTGSTPASSPNSVTSTGPANSFPCTGGSGGGATPRDLLSDGQPASPLTNSDDGTASTMIKRLHFALQKMHLLVTGIRVCRNVPVGGGIRSLGTSDGDGSPLLGGSPATTDGDSVSLGVTPPQGLGIDRPSSGGGLTSQGDNSIATAAAATFATELEQLFGEHCRTFSIVKDVSYGRNIGLVANVTDAIITCDALREVSCVANGFAVNPAALRAICDQVLPKGARCYDDDGDPLADTAAGPTLLSSGTGSSLDTLDTREERGRVVERLNEPIDPAWVPLLLSFELRVEDEAGTVVRAVQLPNIGSGTPPRHVPNRGLGRSGSAGRLGSDDMLDPMDFCTAACSISGASSPTSASTSGNGASLAVKLVINVRSVPLQLMELCRGGLRPPRLVVRQFFESYCSSSAVAVAEERDGGDVALQRRRSSAATEPPSTPSTGSPISPPRGSAVGRGCLGVSTAGSPQPPGELLFHQLPSSIRGVISNTQTLILKRLTDEVLEATFRSEGFAVLREIADRMPRIGAETLPIHHPHHRLHELFRGVSKGLNESGIGSSAFVGGLSPPDTTIGSGILSVTSSTVGTPANRLQVGLQQRSFANATVVPPAAAAALSSQQSQQPQQLRSMSQPPTDNGRLLNICADLPSVAEDRLRVLTDLVDSVVRPALEAVPQCYHTDGFQLDFSPGTLQTLHEAPSLTDVFRACFAEEQLPMIHIPRHLARRLLGTSVASASPSPPQTPPQLQQHGTSSPTSSTPPTLSRKSSASKLNSAAPASARAAAAAAAATVAGSGTSAAAVASAGVAAATAQQQSIAPALKRPTTVGESDMSFLFIPPAELFTGYTWFLATIESTGDFAVHLYCFTRRDWGIFSHDSSRSPSVEPSPAIAIAGANAATPTPAQLTLLSAGGGTGGGCGEPSFGVSPLDAPSPNAGATGGVESLASSAPNAVGQDAAACAAFLNATVSSATGTFPLLSVATAGSAAGMSGTATTELQRAMLRRTTAKLREALRASILGLAVRISQNQLLSELMRTQQADSDLIPTGWGEQHQIPGKRSEIPTTGSVAGRSGGGGGSAGGGGKAQPSAASPAMGAAGRAASSQLQSASFTVASSASSPSAAANAQALENCRYRLSGKTILALPTPKKLTARVLIPRLVMHFNGLRIVNRTGCFVTMDELNESAFHYFRLIYVPPDPKHPPLVEPLTYGATESALDANGRDVWWDPNAYPPVLPEGGKVSGGVVLCQLYTASRQPAYARLASDVRAAFESIVTGEIIKRLSSEREIGKPVTVPNEDLAKMFRQNVDAFTISDPAFCSASTRVQVFRNAVNHSFYPFTIASDDGEVVIPSDAPIAAPLPSVGSMRSLLQGGTMLGGSLNFSNYDLSDLATHSESTNPTVPPTAAAPAAAGDAAESSPDGSGGNGSGGGVMHFRHLMIPSDASAHLERAIYSTLIEIDATTGTLNAHVFATLGFIENATVTTPQNEQRVLPVGVARLYQSIWDAVCEYRMLHTPIAVLCAAGATPLISTAAVGGVAGLASATSTSSAEANTTATLLTPIDIDIAATLANLGTVPLRRAPALCSTLINFVATASPSSPLFLRRLVAFESWRGLRQEREEMQRITRPSPVVLLNMLDRLIQELSVLRPVLISFDKVNGDELRNVRAWEGFPWGDCERFQQDLDAPTRQFIIVCGLRIESPASARIIDVPAATKSTVAPATAPTTPGSAPSGSAAAVASSPPPLLSRSSGADSGGGAASTSRRGDLSPRGAPPAATSDTSTAQLSPQPPQKRAMTLLDSTKSVSYLVRQRQSKITDAALSDAASADGGAPRNFVIITASIDSGLGAYMYNMKESPSIFDAVQTVLSEANEQSHILSSVLVQGLGIATNTGFSEIRLAQVCCGDTAVVNETPLSVHGEVVRRAWFDGRLTNASEIYATGLGTSSVAVAADAPSQQQQPLPTADSAMSDRALQLPSVVSLPSAPSNANLSILASHPSIANLTSMTAQPQSTTTAFAVAVATAAAATATSSPPLPIGTPLISAARMALLRDFVTVIATLTNKGRVVNDTFVRADAIKALHDESTAAWRYGTTKTATSASGGGTQFISSERSLTNCGDALDELVHLGLFVDVQDVEMTSRGHHRGDTHVYKICDAYSTRIPNNLVVANDFHRHIAVAHIMVEAKNARQKIRSCFDRLASMWPARHAHEADALQLVAELQAECKLQYGSRVPHFSDRTEVMATQPLLGRGVLGKRPAPMPQGDDACMLINGILGEFVAHVRKQQPKSQVFCVDPYNVPDRTLGAFVDERLACRYGRVMRSTLLRSVPASTSALLSSDGSAGGSASGDFEVIFTPNLFFIVEPVYATDLVSASPTPAGSPPASELQSGPLAGDRGANDRIEAFLVAEVGFQVVNYALDFFVINSTAKPDSIARKISQYKQNFKFSSVLYDLTVNRLFAQLKTLQLISSPQRTTPQRIESRRPQHQQHLPELEHLADALERLLGYYPGAPNYSINCVRRFQIDDSATRDALLQVCNASAPSESSPSKRLVRCLAPKNATDLFERRETGERYEYCGLLVRNGADDVCVYVLMSAASPGKALSDYSRVSSSMLKNSAEELLNRLVRQLIAAKDDAMRAFSVISGATGIDSCPVSVAVETALGFVVASPCAAETAVLNANLPYLSGIALCAILRELSHETIVTSCEHRPRLVSRLAGYAYHSMAGSDSPGRQVTTVVLMPRKSTQFFVLARFVENTRRETTVSDFVVCRNVFDTPAAAATQPQELCDADIAEARERLAREELRCADTLLQLVLGLIWDSILTPIGVGTDDDPYTGGGGGSALGGAGGGGLSFLDSPGGSQRGTPLKPLQRRSPYQ